MQLNKSIERWLRCDPRSMAKMSEMAIMYAFEDARTDILSLHKEIERLNTLLLTPPNAALTGAEPQAERPR